MLNLVAMTDALGVSASLSLSLLLEGLLGRGLLPRVADGVDGWSWRAVSMTSKCDLYEHLECCYS